MRHLSVPITSAALAALLLAGCSVSPGAETEPRPAGTSTPEAVETDSPAEDGSAVDDVVAVADACGLTDDDYAVIRESLQTANLAPIGPYLAPSVYVTYAASEYGGPVDGNSALVLQNLEDVSYPGVTWNFTPPASDLAIWQASTAYGQDFTDCSIVGVQSDGRGVSLTVVDGLITRELITLLVEAWGY
jgi:hypothetical protein